MATPKGKRMRTAGDVVKRLMWDPALPEDGFTVGYLDRFVGVLEEDFYGDEDLIWTDVPEHRIQWFRYRGVTVWDKSSRLDLVFGTARGNGRKLPAVVVQIDAFLDSGTVTNGWAPEVHATTEEAGGLAEAAEGEPDAAAPAAPSEAGSTLSAAPELSLAPPAAAVGGRARSASDPGAGRSAAPSPAERPARAASPAVAPPGATHAIVAPLDMPLLARRLGSDDGTGCVVPLAWLCLAASGPGRTADEAAATALLPPLARRAAALVPPETPLTAALGRPASGADAAPTVPLRPHAGVFALAAAALDAAVEADLDAEAPAALCARALPAAAAETVASRAVLPMPGVTFVRDEDGKAASGEAGAVQSLLLVSLAPE